MTMDTFFFFFNDTATTEIYTLSLHDALPILRPTIKAIHESIELKDLADKLTKLSGVPVLVPSYRQVHSTWSRSEEHTSELQSHLNLVCRLLLEKKKRHNRLSSARLQYATA